MRSEHVFDVVVIGGGLTGAAIARDAAMRGYATLLLEKEDFGAGATARAFGLVQGGLGDLDLLDLGLVRRALAERATLERIAPHLVRPLACLRPVFAGDRRPLWMVGAGVKLRAWLARERRARARTIGAAEARRLEPCLEPAGLAGAALYTDDQILSPERLCLETVLSAREAGAKAVNHVAVTGLRPRADGLTEVDVESTLTGAADTVAGRVVVNAAGPWTDRLRRAAGLTGRPTVRLARRIHLAVRGVARHALVASVRGDGRPFVVLPRRGWSVIAAAGGGADADVDSVAATPAEVDDLLAEAMRLLPGARLTQDDVFFARAGVEALALAPSGGASRRYVIRAEGPRGTLLSVAGGTLTTVRALAEAVTDRIAREVGRRDGCRTAETPLYGGHLASIERAVATDAPALARRYALPSSVAVAMVETYGSRAGDVLAPTASDPALARRLCDRSPDIVAQVKYAVDRESAVTLRDLLFRRLAAGTGPCQGRDCAARAAEAMARFAGWDERRRERELAAFFREADLGQEFRSAAAGSRTTRSEPTRPLSAR